jgi:hypothetical protein
MHREVLGSLVLLLFIALVTTMVVSYNTTVLLQDAFATSSPSFLRQEIPPSNENFFDLFKGEVTPNGPDYVDIQSVSYSSNGKYLNATIWLRNFTSIPLDHEYVNYGMYFDVDSNNRTGLRGIDYKIEISWNNTNKTWTKAFEEWSSDGNTKTLSEVPAQNFTEKGKSYVTLSVDMDAMLSPNNYKVLFYAEVLDLRRLPSDWLVDATNWVYIPAPDLNLSVSPGDSIVLVQGEKSTVEVRINSTTADGIMLDLYPLSENNNSSVLMRFDSLRDTERLQIAPYGVGSTHLQISAAPDAEPTVYTMTLLANVTPINEPLFIKPRFTEPTAGDTSDTGDTEDDSALVKLIESNYVTDEIVVKQSTFSLEIKKWAFEEQLNDFVNQWLTPLTAIYTTISAIVSGILGWIYGRMQKRGRKKNKDNNRETKDNPEGIV